MKTLALLKKEVMHFEASAYVLWILSLGVGCFAYLNPPLYIARIGGFITGLGDIFGMFKKVGELVWALGSTFLFGTIAVIATKFGTRIWEDKIKPQYEKWTGKKKKNKDNIY